jgi:hypothetical protein
LISVLITCDHLSAAELHCPSCTCYRSIRKALDEAVADIDWKTLIYTEGLDHRPMWHRIGQRVTQAPGRANRTADDRALHIGLDRGFAQVLADSAVRATILQPPHPQGDALELFDGWQAT